MNSIHPGNVQMQGLFDKHNDGDSSLFFGIFFSQKNTKNKK